MSRLMRFLFSINYTHSSNAHAQPSSGARCLIFGWTILLLPYFMCLNGNGSGKTTQMHRLVWAFAGRLCDKYHNLMSWLKYWLSTATNMDFTETCGRMLLLQLHWIFGVLLHVRFFIAGLQLIHARDCSQTINVCFSDVTLFIYFSQSAWRRRYRNCYSHTRNYRKRWCFSFTQVCQTGTG